MPSSHPHIECLKCHQMGHYASSCPSRETNDHPIKTGTQFLQMHGDDSSIDSNNVASIDSNCLISAQSRPFEFSIKQTHNQINKIDPH